MSGDREEEEVVVLMLQRYIHRDCGEGRGGRPLFWAAFQC